MCTCVYASISGNSLPISKYNRVGLGQCTVSQHSSLTAPYFRHQDTSRLNPVGLAHNNNNSPTLEQVMSGALVC